MMFCKSSLVGFLLLLLNQTVVASDEEYFKKSIFNALRDRNGQFSSENEIHQLVDNYFKPENGTLTWILNDKYSFKLNIGENVLTMVRFNESRKAIYLKSEEVYILDKPSKDCLSLPYSKAWKSFISVPNIIFNQNNETYKTLGEF